MHNIEHNSKTMWEVLIISVSLYLSAKEWEVFLCLKKRLKYIPFKLKVIIKFVKKAYSFLYLQNW